MARKTVFLLVSVAVLVVPAAAQQDGGCDPGYNQVDADYLGAMIEHHRGAVEMAELVSGHTDRAELINLSEMIIEVQESEIEHMEALLNESCVDPAISDERHIAPTDRQVDYMEGLNGAEFDLAFINMMAAHHADALMESRIALEEGESEEVKEVARNVTEGQQEEIRQMYRWYLEWS